MRAPEVWVTGMGLVTPIGIGVPATWQALLQGRSGIKTITRYATDWLPVHIAGEIQDFDFFQFDHEWPGYPTSPCTALGVVAGQEALRQAGYAAATEERDYLDMDMVLASVRGDYFRYERAVYAYLKNQGEHPHRQEEVNFLLSNPLFHYTTRMAQKLRLRGRWTMISNACIAGGNAIAIAADRIRAGMAEAVLCGGVDPLILADYVGFVNLRALAPDKCQPFDKNRKGLVMSEAAGLLILESSASVAKRGVTPLARLAGFGWSADAYHLTTPRPDGSGIALAMERALHDAGKHPQDIGGIIAHGTGTPSNDKVEAQVIRRLFGEPTPPVTAPKSMLGHSLGAASAVEAVIGVLALQHQILPPTINLEELDPECPIQCVGHQAQPTTLTTCLTNSAGFGGNNSALIFTQPD